MPTLIEWVQNPDGTKGETWNPVTGCTKISAGCANCYAERMARRLAGRYGYPEAPHHFDVTLHPERLEQPLRWQKPRTVFVCSMGDLFHENVPTHYIADVWNIMRQCPQHTFQVLTKRPYPMLSILSDWNVVLTNVWLLITAENQAAADERIPLLLQIPAAVRGVSCEPLLGSLDLNLSSMSSDGYKMLSRWYGPDGFDKTSSQPEREQQKLDWVICGPETGPGARGIAEFEPRARGLRDQCVEAGIAFFLKKNTNGTRQIDGREWNELPQ